MRADFVKVAETIDIQPSSLIAEFREKLCTVNVGLGNIRAHLDRLLIGGTFEEYDVAYPCHGYRFDIRTCGHKLTPEESIC
jgi:hypothetical protein